MGEGQERDGVMVGEVRKCFAMLGLGSSEMVSFFLFLELGVREDK